MKFSLYWQMMSVLLLVVMISILFFEEVNDEPVVELTDAQKLSNLEKFMDDALFNGGYYLQWGTNDLEELDGTFSDSTFIRISKRKNYREMADYLVEKLLPYLGIPNKQVRFERIDADKFGGASVYYYQVIEGHLMDPNFVGMRVEFLSDPVSYVVIDNSLVYLHGLKERIKISKVQAIAIAKASIEKNSTNGWETTDTSKPPIVTLLNYEKTDKNGTEYVLCWKVYYKQYNDDPPGCIIIPIWSGITTVYVDVENGNIVHQE